MSIFLSFISRIFIILTSFVPCYGSGMVDQKITFNLVLIWKLESRPEDERNKTNHNCRSYYMSELKFYRNLKHKSPLNKESFYRISKELLITFFFLIGSQGDGDAYIRVPIPLSQFVSIVFLGLFSYHDSIHVSMTVNNKEINWN